MSDKDQKTPLTINQKVATWVQGQLGKKVGRGECWDLGEQALQQAGAKTSNDLGSVDEDTDYIWGDSIAVKDVMSGDILQIRDHERTTTTTTTYTFADGTVVEEEKFSTEKKPHHTAIVNGKLDADGAVATLEQNVDPLGKIVQNQKLYTRDVAAVLTNSVEKMRHPKTKKLETVKAAKTVTITVTGTIWAYRPKAK